MSKLLDIIKGNIRDYDIEYRVHAIRRMFQRQIHPQDIENLITEGDIVEN